MIDIGNPYMKKTLPSYSQYVDCNTREEAILDMCYGNIKGAYRAIKNPPISTSDHNAILLLPTYETKLKREGVDIRERQLWSTEVENQIKFEFECTDWSVLTDPDCSIDDNIDVVTEYLLFVEECVVPKKSVRVFANDKPWINKDLKAKILAKNKLFKEGKKIEGKVLQHESTKGIKKGKVH